MKPKIIKTEAEHAAALARIGEIFAAKPGTSEGDELELLIHLVEQYEKEAFPIDLPDPLAAIHFRMEQKGLKPKDLISYLGSASKVSEVLSGRRGLSVSMIRNLVHGLGIPASVLLQKPGARLAEQGPLAEVEHYPVAEMVHRGWFPGFSGTVREAKERLDELMAAFVGPLGMDALRPALNRQRVRSGSRMDAHALAAWRIRVMNRALKESVPPYADGTVTVDFVQEVVRLSYLEAGPTLAKEYLAKSGIHLIAEPHLPRTFLDGAAMRLPDGSALVALTLRYDRLDHFWFTLCHELAHVGLHLDRTDHETFFDDLNDASKDAWEKDADALAAEALIPKTEWKAAKLNAKSTSAEVGSFAERLRINPAIPAGRVRYESRNYKLFPELVGNRTVRRLFAAESS